MILTVKVTQKHIDNGKRNDCNKCPIALALAEFIINYPIKIWSQGVAIYDCKNIVKVPFPQEARYFIDYFDNNSWVSPFEFKIEIDEKFIKKS